MHELHSAIFAPLLGAFCAACNLGSSMCDRPRGLNNDGQLISATDPTCLVTWPACPHRWTTLRRNGQDLTTIAQLAERAHDLGAHRSPSAPAPLVRVVTEWIRCSRMCEILRANKLSFDARGGA